MDTDGLDDYLREDAGPEHRQASFLSVPQHEADEEHRL